MKDKTVLTVDVPKSCTKPKCTFDIDADEYFCALLEKYAEKYKDIYPDAFSLPISVKQYLEEIKQTSVQQ